MSKQVNVNFHQTFKPECQYISSILDIADGITWRSVKDISAVTGIPQVVTFDIFTFLIFVKMSICQFAFLVKRHRITVQSIHIKLFSQDASSGFIYNLRHTKNISIISKENDGDISPYLFL